MDTRGMRRALDDFEDNFYSSMEEQIRVYIQRAYGNRVSRRQIINRSGNLQRTIDNLVVKIDRNTGDIMLGIMYYGFFLNYGTRYISARPFLPDEVNLSEMVDIFVKSYKNKFPDDGLEITEV